jgi:molybdenum cofactor synthesis domain-containing protein
MSSAAVIIIGNEILSGRFTDENGPYLVRRLREIGVDLRRLVVAPDEVETIAAEVASIHGHVDWVFTSGGIGPTHDDVTYEGVARGLGMAVRRRQELAAVVEQRFSAPISEAAWRMAEIPEGAVLWWGGQIHWPIVVARNVVTLPGVPRIFRPKFEGIAERFRGIPVQVLEIRTSHRETAIASTLIEAAKAHPGVHIGSYPLYTGQPPYEVLLLLEGRDPAELHRCRDSLDKALALLGNLPSDLDPVPVLEGCDRR